MKKKIYLAGGLRSNWQEKLFKKFKKDFIIYNPQQHGLENDPSHYTTWDLFHVKDSDIVFAYMEKNNPSGYGLALEIGYAKSLNKTIILVDEKSETDLKFKRYFEIVRNSSNVVFSNLEKGIDFVATFT